MDKLGISKGIKVRANINRILEMVDGGAGDNAISGHFKDEGVAISPQFIKAIRTEIDEFTKKAISKSSTKRAIKVIQKDQETADHPSPCPA
jgi:hypothetical protein